MLFLIYRLLDAAISGNTIPVQDRQKTFGYVGNNPIGSEIMWDYVEANWDRIAAM